MLDTHAVLWWFAGDDAISVAARSAIADARNSVFVSAASAWEITTKHRLGKLNSAVALIMDLAGCLARQGFAELPISIRHAQAAGALPGPHRDPFDRMLIAQAMQDDLVLVSNERLFEAYGVHRLW